MGYCPYYSQGTYLIKRQGLGASMSDCLHLHKRLPEMTEKCYFVQYGTLSIGILSLAKDSFNSITQYKLLDRVSGIVSIQHCRNQEFLQK